jgi:hypothetical protein
MSEAGGRRARRAPPVPLVRGCEVHTMNATRPIVKSELQPRAESSRKLAALPGSRRYRCGGCRHERLILGIATDPDCCGRCGSEW